MTDLSKAYLILNGHIDVPSLKADVQHCTPIYCADGALNQIAHMKLPIEAVIGDMDSLSHLQLDTPQIHLPDQHQTDFEKSLCYLSKSYQSIDVYGASGGEMDHFLGNLSVAKKYHQQINIQFYDEHFHYFYVEKSTTLNHIKNKLVSIMPFPQLSNLSLEGFQYSLHQQTLALGQMLGTRNVAVSDIARITFTSGGGFVFIQR